MIGIYKLNFKGTTKVYIGQSTNIRRRFVEHLNSVSNGTANYKIVEAFSLYGKPTLEILCECDQEELCKLEEEAIEIFDSVNNGFNILSTATKQELGENNPNSKYSREQLIEVFRFLLEGENINNISIATDINISTVLTISAGLQHNWLREVFTTEYDNYMLKKYRRGTHNKNAKYSEEQILEVFEYLTCTPRMLAKEISEITEIPIHTVQQISSCNGHTWLEDKFPEKYAVLRSLKKTQRNSKHT